MLYDVKLWELIKGSKLYRPAGGSFKIFARCISGRGYIQSDDILSFQKYSENLLCLLEEFPSCQAEEASRTDTQDRHVTPADDSNAGGITLIHRYPLLGLMCKTAVQP